MENELNSWALDFEDTLCSLLKSYMESKVRVAPFAGARIEILNLDESLPFDNVAPFAGARIKKRMT